MQSLCLLSKASPAPLQPGHLLLPDPLLSGLLVLMAQTLPQHPQMNTAQGYLPELLGAAELAVLARLQAWPARLGSSHIAAGGQEGGAVLPSLISN